MSLLYTSRCLVGFPRPPKDSFPHMTCSFLGRTWEENINDTQANIKKFAQEKIQPLLPIEVEAIEKIKLGPKQDIPAMKVRVVDKKSLEILQEYSRLFGQFEKFMLQDNGQTPKEEFKHVKKTPNFHITFGKNVTEDFLCIGDRIQLASFGIKPLGPCDEVFVVYADNVHEFFDTQYFV